jgi:hypothetical protein
MKMGSQWKASAAYIRKEMERHGQLKHLKRTITMPQAVADAALPEGEVSNEDIRKLMMALAFWYDVENTPEHPFDVSGLMRESNHAASLWMRLALFLAYKIYPSLFPAHVGGLDLEAGRPAVNATGPFMGLRTSPEVTVWLIAGVDKLRVKRPELSVLEVCKILARNRSRPAGYKALPKTMADHYAEAKHFMKTGKPKDSTRRRASR